MVVHIVRSNLLDIFVYNRIKELLSTFNSPLNFVFSELSFNEDSPVWDRRVLNNLMVSHRNLNVINESDFLIFITISRDEENWFSACFEEWNKNIFVNASDWIDDHYFKSSNIEYPIAHQIIENLFQHLQATNYEEYYKLSHNKSIGCINDMCFNKPDISLKLRTADICNKCMKIANERIQVDILDQIIEILETIRYQFLHSKKNHFIFNKIVQKAKLKILIEAKEFLLSCSDKNEKYIQDWLDEENGRYRQRRSIIFGIEYIDPKREGYILNNKRFDILAEQNMQNHIIIELKSPAAPLFEIKEKKTKNGGKNTEYSISKDLARAIPQILLYKRGYENMNDEQLQSIGLLDKKRISESIIVIGTRKDHDKIWLQAFDDLKKALSIKIYTYTDLIDKINNSIHNLENT